MMTPNNPIFLILTMGPLLALCLFHYRFLMSLLNLEMIMLSLMLSSMMLEGYLSGLDSLTIMFILTLAASDAAVGLACLVMITRSNSSDNMMSCMLSSY